MALNKAVSFVQLLMRSARIPLILLLVMWAVFGAEVLLNRSFSAFGVYPREWSGIKGILFMPFLHGDFNHIANNSAPFFVLTTLLFTFYHKVAWRVFIFTWLVTGLWLWAGGRPSFHIGASGLIYALAAFLFFSGVFNKSPYMMGLSLLIVFLYGSMIWYVFPIKAGISWEGHLFGALSGLLFAWIYRSEGPKRKTYQLNENLDLLQAKYGEKYWDPEFVAERERKAREERERVLQVHYFYKEKEKE